MTESVKPSEVAVTDSPTADREPTDAIEPLLTLTPRTGAVTDSPTADREPTDAPLLTLTPRTGAVTDSPTADREPTDAIEPLLTLTLKTSAVALRRAALKDLQPILTLLAADQLGSARESFDSETDSRAYERAFAAIDADPAHLLIVATNNPADNAANDTANKAVDHRGHRYLGVPTVVGTFQLSFIPGLARRGALRAQIEAVRVHEDYRGQGLGAAMMRWAIDEAARRGCALVQLTTDKTRTDAHRFYERLGFVASHEGMKLHL